MCGCAPEKKPIHRTDYVKNIEVAGNKSTYPRSYSGVYAVYS